MKIALVAAGLLCSVMFAAQAPPQPSQSMPTGPNVPKNLKPYFIGLLVRSGKNGGAAASGSLEQRHLAYVRAQVQAGKYVIASPFLDSSAVAGIVYIQAGSIEEARKIAEADPIVKDGHMSMAVHPALAPDLSCVRVDYGK